MEASEEPQEQSESVDLDPDFAPSWPENVREACARFFAFKDEDIRGQGRLGALEFSDAPQRVDQIRSIIRDLALEPWEEMPPNITNSGLISNLNELIETLDKMVALSADSENARASRDELNNRLNERLEWFQQTAAPLAFNAKIDRRVGDRPDSALGQADLSDIEEAAKELKEQQEGLRRELESQSEAVSQARAKAGDSASEELAEVFKERSDDYSSAANKWLIALCVAAPLAVGAAVLTFHLLRPEPGAQDAHDFTGLGLGLFILGLLAFGIRVCAQNVRVNRHLAAVAQSKRSSISTFQRLAASVADEEIRSAVTLTLAQSIFTVEETGLVDGSGDHVTLVERAVLPNLPNSGS